MDIRINKKFIAITLAISQAMTPISYVLSLSDIMTRTIVKDITGSSSYRRSTNLNEGVIELLSMKEMSDMGFNYNSSSYQEQVEVAKALEEAMGSDLMQKAYFTNQPELIRSQFDTAFATESERAALPLGDSICNGKYIEFLDAFDRFISTESSNSNYVTNRDKVYNLIGQYKAKGGYNNGKG